MPIIDFRNTKSVYYNGQKIKEAWYKSVKLWAESANSLDVSSTISHITIFKNTVAPTRSGEVYFKTEKPSSYLSIKGIRINNQEILYFENVVIGGTKNFGARLKMSGDQFQAWKEYLERTTGQMWKDYGTYAYAIFKAGTKVELIF